MAFLSKQGEEDTVAMEPLRRATHTKMFQTSVASPVRRRTIATVPQAASEVEATTVNIVSSPTMAKIVEEKASATETLPTRTRRKCRLSLVSSILLLLIIVQLLSLCIVAGVWYSQYLETTDSLQLGLLQSSAAAISVYLASELGRFDSSILTVTTLVNNGILEDALLYRGQLTCKSFSWNASVYSEEEVVQRTLSGFSNGTTLGDAMRSQFRILSSLYSSEFSDTVNPFLFNSFGQFDGGTLLTVQQAAVLTRDNALTSTYLQSADCEANPGTFTCSPRPPQSNQPQPYDRSIVNTYGVLDVASLDDPGAWNRVTYELGNASRLYHGFAATQIVAQWTPVDWLSTSPDAPACPTLTCPFDLSGLNIDNPSELYDFPACLRGEMASMQSTAPLAPEIVSLLKNQPQRNVSTAVYVRNGLTDPYSIAIVGPSYNGTGFFGVSLSLRAIETDVYERMLLQSQTLLVIQSDRCALPASQSYILVAQQESGCGTRLDCIVSHAVAPSVLTAEQSQLVEFVCEQFEASESSAFNGMWIKSNNYIVATNVLGMDITDRIVVLLTPRDAAQSSVETGTIRAAGASLSLVVLMVFICLLIATWLARRFKKMQSRMRNMVERIDDDKFDESAEDEALLGGFGQLAMLRMMWKRQSQDTRLLAIANKLRAQFYRRRFLDTRAALNSAVTVPWRLPYKPVSVYVGTWNVGNAAPSADLREWIHGDHDLFVFGLQECVFGKGKEASKSGEKFATQVQKLLGPDYIRVSLVSILPSNAERLIDGATKMSGLRVLVMARREHALFIDNVSVGREGTGIAHMGWNKGGVGVSLSFYGRSFLFVNAHLAAHQGKLSERKDNITEILTGLNAKLTPSDTLTSAYDYFFFFGDLNFRVDLPREEVLSLIESKEETGITRLLEHDQLNIARKSAFALADFDEAPITFMPTFKMERQRHQVYESKVKRVPSYCDRVLLKRAPHLPVRCLEYASAPHILSSDHRPVFATFLLDLPLHYAPPRPTESCTISIESLRITTIFAPEKPNSTTAGKFHVGVSGHWFQPTELLACEGTEHVLLCPPLSVRPVFSDRRWLREQSLVMSLTREKTASKRDHFQGRLSLGPLFDALASAVATDSAGLVSGVPFELTLSRHSPRRYLAKGIMRISISPLIATTAVPIESKDADSGSADEHTNAAATAAAAAFTVASRRNSDATGYGPDELADSLEFSGMIDSDHFRAAHRESSSTLAFSGMIDSDYFRVAHRESSFASNSDTDTSSITENSTTFESESIV